MQVDYCEVVKKSEGFSLYGILGFFNKCAEVSKENIKMVMDYDKANIVIGLVFGDTSNIEDEITEDFKIVNLSHILAISGMHISYIILFVSKTGKRILGKRFSLIFTIIILAIYLLIAKSSPSIIRASVMGILLIVSKLIHTKTDFLTSLSLAGLITLVYNPYLINSLGFQFSYIGTIGIVFLQRDIHRYIHHLISKIRKKNRSFLLIQNKLFISLRKKVIKNYIKSRNFVIEIAAVTLSAQIIIFPILIYNTNMITPYFLITNILASFLLPFIILFSFLIAIFSNIQIQVALDMNNILSVLLDGLINISKIAKLPFSSVYVPTLKIVHVLAIYIAIFLFKCILSIYTSNRLTITQIRIKQTIAMYKYKYSKKDKKNKKYKQVLAIVLILVMIFGNRNIFNTSIDDIFLERIKIRMVDVGQGDCVFITTNENKTILVDGGGSVFSSFDVGKSTLLPYILDRGYTSIDYVIVSHFDSDHVGRNNKLSKRIESA